MGQRWTKRPQNSCRRCGYTWYPRGKHVSHSCPRCGSRDVELAIDALFRAIGEFLAAIVFCIVGALKLALAAVIWVGRQAIRLVATTRTRVPKPAGGQGVASPGAPGTSRRLLSSTPVTPTAAPVQAGSRWSAIRRFVAAFLTWVASVNDDITGVNENPSTFGVLAKLLVILSLGVAVFAFVILVCRSVGLL